MRFSTGFVHRRARRAYTLVEILIVVAVLGIAGALVIPSMSQTGVLRIQAAVRTLVADMTFMQADAMAFQSRRVMVFGRVARFDPDAATWQVVNGDGYTVYAPPAAPVLDEHVGGLQIAMNDTGEMRVGEPHPHRLDDPP